MNLDFNDLPDIAIEYLNYMLTIKNTSKKTVSEYYYDLRTFFRYIKVIKYNADENDFKNIAVDDITAEDLKKLILLIYMAFYPIPAVNLIIQPLPVPVRFLFKIFL